MSILSPKRIILLRYNMYSAPLGQLDGLEFTVFPSWTLQGAKMASQRQSERLNLLQLLLAWRACCPIYFAESRKDNLRGKITPLVHLCKYEMIKLYVAYWVIKDLYFMQNCKVGIVIPFKK